MKTAISLPDDVFADVERHAAARGVSRSEFFVTAVRRFVADLEAQSLTGRINASLDMAWPTGVVVDPAGFGAHARTVEDTTGGTGW